MCEDGAVAEVITKQSDIAKLKPADSRYRVKVENETDEGKKLGGLCLQLSPGGQKAYYYRYRFQGKAAECRLGASSPQFKLKDARGLHAELWHVLDKGRDPGLYLKLQRQAAQKADAETCQHLFEEWVAHYAETESPKTRRKPSASVVAKHKRRWGLYCDPLKAFPFRDVERVQVLNLVDKIAKRGSRGNGAAVEARHVLSLIRQMFHYAVNRGYMQASPAATINGGDAGVSNGEVRERSLKTHELRQLWAALDSAVAGREGLPSSVALSLQVASVVKLLILTGQRVSEVAQMQWRELDFNEGVWTIPGERSKNRRAHIVHLSPLAVDLIVAMKPFTGASPYVFESAVKPGHAIRSDVVGKAIARLQGIPATKKQPSNEDAPLFGLDHFTPHDLRRSAATAWASDLNIFPHIVEHMLNHTLPRLQRTYQRGEYLPERREAFSAWGERVETLIASDPGSNVTAITGRGA